MWNWLPNSFAIVPTNLGRIGPARLGAQERVSLRTATEDSVFEFDVLLRRMCKLSRCLTLYVFDGFADPSGTQTPFIGTGNGRGACAMPRFALVLIESRGSERGGLAVGSARAGVEAHESGPGAACRVARATGVTHDVTMKMRGGAERARYGIHYFCM